ncbi:transglutaminase-like cysteine peptidase [Allorhizobium sp. BGMRC 0089]|uniref:transglutaminase-like cysteine peptidase n=1 Tax=Allorhizobium sonneratiae TaxID=2934936 RepID=UPI00203497C6|nr:transglutaminase-like cysteine peptidase [Allorhizobium sonneratiae]MCM2293017.1 transglutaminase-like cysteine peptidase [Allorhizobium sonneratiae]
MFQTIVTRSITAIFAMMLIATGSAQATEVTGAEPSAYAEISAGRTSVPIGWYLFCKEQSVECHETGSPQDQVMLNSQKWQDLLEINYTVNANIVGVTDENHYHIYEKGIPNWWTYPDDGMGNCNDYAILKKRLLEEAGWPSSALHLTVVLDHHGEGHLILMVSTDHGDLILDCLTNKVMKWYQTGYKFLKRQSSDNPNSWVAFTNVVQEVARVGSIKP